MKKQKNKKKKVKVIYVDDGRTIYDMSEVTRPNPFGSPSFGKDKHKDKNKDKKKAQSTAMSKKEKWAAIKAAYATYLPILGIIIVGFFLAMGLFFLLFR